MKYNIKKEWEARMETARKYSAQVMPYLPYHNLFHVVDVEAAAKRLMALEGIFSFEQKFILLTAVYFHDIIYEAGAESNEERSAGIAAEVLPKLGYLHSQVGLVQELILATKIPTKPNNKLEEIICDADLDNLGRKDFFKKSELLRIENKAEDERQWYIDTLKFLQNHRFYTVSARYLRQKGLERNILILESKIRKNRF